MNSSAKLSKRQEDMVRLAGLGLADKQIAAELGIGEGTLRTYWQRLREKTSARSRAEIIARNLNEECESLRQMADLNALLIRRLPGAVWTIPTSLSEAPGRRWTITRCDASES